MRATGLSLALCLAGTLVVSAEAWSAPPSAVLDRPAPLVCSDAPAHPGLKTTDTAMQRGYGDEPGDAMNGQHGRHDKPSDTAVSEDANLASLPTNNSVLVHNHLNAHSAVLDTVGQDHDPSMASGSDAQALGLTVRPLTQTERQSLGVDSGLLVTGVSAGMGLKAGFQPGDVVLSLDGVDVTTSDQFYKLAQKLPHDRPVPVLVHRPTSTLFLPLEAPARR
jgi:hypothetical protein